MEPMIIRASTGEHWSGGPHCLPFATSYLILKNKNILNQKKICCHIVVGISTYMNETNLPLDEQSSLDEMQSSVKLSYSRIEN